jgi:hypothetical protein
MLKDCSIENQEDSRNEGRPQKNEYGAVVELCNLYGTEIKKYESEQKTECCPNPGAIDDYNKALNEAVQEIQKLKKFIFDTKKGFVTTNMRDTLIGDISSKWDKLEKQAKILKKPCRSPPPPPSPPLSPVPSPPPGGSSSGEPIQIKKRTECQNACETDAHLNNRRLSRRLAIAAPSEMDVANAAIERWADAGVPIDVDGTPFSTSGDLAAKLVSESHRLAEMSPGLPMTTALSATPLGACLGLVAGAELYGLLGDEASANFTRSLFEASCGFEYDSYRDEFFETMCSDRFDCAAVFDRVSATPEFATLLEALGIDPDSESGRKLLGFWSWFEAVVGVILIIAAVAAVVATCGAGAVIVAGVATAKVATEVVVVAAVAGAIGTAIAIDGAVDIVKGVHKTGLDTCLALC